MKNVEVTRIGAKSVFKVTVYLMVIPIAIMVLVGLVTSIIGIATGEYELLFAFLPLIIMPFFMIFGYGLLGMLVAVIYNALSNKFGGLELQIDSLEPEPPRVLNERAE